MTEAETPVAASGVSAPVKPASSYSSARHWLLFGTGLGIAAGPRNLDWAIVRSRPSGPIVIAAGSIRDFRTRPAAEWGAELAGLMATARERHLAASLLLPRDEVIVRTLHLPGVPGKEVEAAIALQADTLHPYGDEEVVFGWVKAGGDSVLVGLVRKASLDYYETLFSEAGIGLTAVTFSAAVIHAALRIRSSAPASFLCYSNLSHSSGDKTEVYGESEARPVYSAEFSFAPARALAFARAELRLAPDFEAQPLADAMAVAGGTSPMPYAVALVASAPLATRFANLLPKERRASSARRQYLLPLSLAAAAVIAALICFVAIPAMERRSYLKSLNEEIRVLQPAAQRAQTLDKQIAANRLKIASLDDFRRRTQADLDVLNELTRLLPPPVWTNSIEIYPDNVVIAGEADQASTLLKTIDSSPLFQDSVFALSVTHNGTSDQFRIKTMRRGRAGRSTP